MGFHRSCCFQCCAATPFACTLTAALAAGFMEMQNLAFEIRLSVTDEYWHTGAPILEMLKVICCFLFGFGGF